MPGFLFLVSETELMLDEAGFYRFLISGRKCPVIWGQEAVDTGGEGRLAHLWLCGLMTFEPGRVRLHLNVGEVELEVRERDHSRCVFFCRYIVLLIKGLFYFLFNVLLFLVLLIFWTL